MWDIQKENINENLKHTLKNSHKLFEKKYML